MSDERCTVNDLMAFNYKEVMPWGRNFDEYKSMFGLSEDDLRLKILGSGDGPASFNCELNAMGGNVISVDPIYCMTKEQIEKRIAEVLDEIKTQTEKNKEKFKWDVFKSVDGLVEERLKTMANFLETYDKGKADGRYIQAELPNLPFKNNEFNLALCSHLLFLYADNLSAQFHLDSIKELLRVANQVRIFPIIDANGKRPDFFEEIVASLKDFSVEIRKVNYEFQIGGNEVLILKNF